MTKEEQPQYLVIDTENSVKSPIGFAATAFWPENRVVQLGYTRSVSGVSVSGGGYVSDKPFAGTIQEAIAESVKHDRDYPNNPITMIVGQNLKHDLHWMYREWGKGFKDEVDQYPVKVWDTQLAEYLLSGQSDQFIDLDDLSKRYGGTLKDDRLKAMWDAGMQTEEIPTDMLKEYLRNDVSNTMLVFEHQFRTAIGLNMLPLIEAQMEALLATTEMEWNGIKVDTHRANIEVAKLRILLARLDADIEKYLNKRTPEVLRNSKNWELNIQSVQQLATFIFGGTFKYKAPVQVGYYKNGNDKFKVTELTVDIAGFAVLKDEWKTPTGKVRLDEDVIEELLESGQIDPAGFHGNFLKNLLERRDIAKQLHTYYEPLINLQFPDGLIHHKLNHTATITGRLSSSDPNFQNLPRGDTADVKKCIVSRFGKDGFVVEADYSQLEVVGLAFKTQAKVLMQEILDEVDLHTEMAHAQGFEYSAITKAIRTKAKTARFQLQYGAGAKAIAKSNKWKVSEAKGFVKAYYQRYPEIKEFEQKVESEVRRSRVASERRTKKGIPAGMGEYVSETGRRYRFYEYDNDYTGETSFSTTEMKNYPIQGFATADIVPLVLGRMYRVLRNDPALRGKCFMINTVHDSILFDVHRDVLIYALTVIKRVMEAAPEYIKEQFDIDFNLPLRCGLSFGYNWMEQIDVDVDASGIITGKHDKGKKWCEGKGITEILDSLGKLGYNVITESVA